MHLGKIFGKKNRGTDESQNERVEAFKVLFDILVAQLMKQQSFLREMANYVFKQFCMELDSESLENLISIVATPNAKSGEVFDAEADDSDSELGESEYDQEDAEEDEDDEDSDSD